MAAEANELEPPRQRQQPGDLHSALEQAVRVFRASALDYRRPNSGRAIPKDTRLAMAANYEDWARALERHLLSLRPGRRPPVTQRDRRTAAEIEDPMEQLVAAGLDCAQLPYTHAMDMPSRPAGQPGPLDFTLECGVSIEVKRFYTPRADKQLRSNTNVILAQGEGAVNLLARALAALGHGGGE